MRTCELFIDGKWMTSDSGETFESTNPATGESVARLQQGSVTDVDAAVAAANAASTTFRRMPVWERAALCERVAETLATRKDEIAKALSEEQGKPLHTEAYGEINTAIRGFAEASGHIKH